MTPAEVNAKIATLRGWEYTPDDDSEGGGWYSEREPAWHDHNRCREDNPGELPNYCSSWALAGPLLDELAARKTHVTLRSGVPQRSMTHIPSTALEWDCIVWPGGKPALCATSAAESIARAWLAWKEPANA